MNKRLDITLSHHAYYLVGSNFTVQEIKNVLEKEHDFVFVGNPDYYEVNYNVFTIENARELKSQHETRPVSEPKKKIFILVLNGITIEAQNALLNS